MDNQEKVVIELNQPVEVDTSWTWKTLAIGGAVGAITGLLGAYLLVQRSEKIGEPPNLELREGIKLGVLVFTLLRNIALLGE